MPDPGDGGAGTYRPVRQTTFPDTADPLEVELVYQVTPCGTCSFFWPTDPSSQPYGPFPAYDFTSNVPVEAQAPGDQNPFQWIHGVTAPPAFPNPEVMDGCRKAPIMTIGINPNMTAFAPGQTGASWCYPNFGSDDGTDLYAKTAYYYRYRSVFQERFDLDFVRQHLQDSPRVVAPRAGSIVSAERPDDSPSFDLKVLYDGDLVPTTISLVGTSGDPQWVVLFDATPPNNVFQAGDLLAARPDVPSGLPATICRQQVGYYEQFVPVLQQFQSTLRADGHADAALTMGEDVCQLDMVACASPHWGPGFLGGSDDSEKQIVNNCVTTNHWAIRQLVQTKPAVLYLVGEASWNMFRDAFGALVQRDTPLSAEPADGAFTLLSETCDSAHPCELQYSFSDGGVDYELRTRLVITPHFSYSVNFAPQYRLSPDVWADLQSGDPGCADFLQHDSRITYVPGQTEYDFAAFMVAPDQTTDVAAALASTFAQSSVVLAASFYDAHSMMAGVLDDLYHAGAIQYGSASGASGNVLMRTDGSCRFCVNDHWTFPLGCPYGKPAEAPPPPGFLRQVAQQMAASGRAQPASTVDSPPAGPGAT